ncbi:amidohydrolase family protein [Candidatus Woesearchaeota archaeon]|nr:amidohydrolase family protein [Candidatus Woesearchaeota archaeon]
MKTRKLIITLGVILVVLVVAGFITKAVIEKVTRDITEREMQRMGMSITKALKDIPCDKITSLRQFSSSAYYSGPLIDTHLHMPLTFEVPKAMYAQADYDGAVLEKEVAAGSIVCLFDKTNVKSAYGFYVIPNLLKGEAVNAVTKVDSKFAGRITPFIMSAHVTALNLQPSDVESVLSANPGLFKGYGELALYKDAYLGIKPDDESLRPFYDIAAKHGLIVMIHPDEGQREEVETILKDYPKVKFLFHGFETEAYVAKIVAAYPNAFYTMDQLSDIPYEHQSVSLYGDKTKESFIANFKRDHDQVLAIAIKAWKNAIEKNPDKFLWGTDRAYVWHFDPEVSALLDEIGREFIGQLDPAVQEKFAYKNAERLINVD